MRIWRIGLADNHAGIRFRYYRTKLRATRAFNAAKRQHRRAHKAFDAKHHESTITHPAYVPSRYMRPEPVRFELLKDHLVDLLNDETDGMFWEGTDV